MNKSGVLFLALGVMFLFGGMSCSGDGSEVDETYPFDMAHRPWAPVVVSGIVPAEGGMGDKVVVRGDNFGNDPDKISLTFNDKKAVIIKALDNAIYAFVPKLPGEFSTIKVEIDGQEGVLEDLKFRYIINAEVTTIAGIRNVREDPPTDGPALEATFYRPVKIAVDDIGNVLVADDQAGASIRHISTKTNFMSTVLKTATPWSCTFNTQFSHYYVMERDSSQRPVLFYSLSKASNYTEPEIFYDHRRTNGNYLFGARRACGFAADDTYLYMMSEGGFRFVRVHQTEKTVELIGLNLPTGVYQYMVYNTADKMIYMALEESGRVMRFDPYHTPPGRTTPWITWEDMEWVIGSGVVSDTSNEGNGRDAQLGTLSGLGADHEGNVYISDMKFHCVWKVDRSLNCTIYAGPPAGQAVDGYRNGKPEEALFRRPYDITVTNDGQIYVADTYNFVVRRISIQ